MSTLAAIGGIGGIIAALGAVLIIGKGLFRQINATEDNTAAVRELTGKVESLFQLYSGHETRLAILEDRIKR